ncbi:choice-of-anchor D domain-containing protein [bacterium]|nr:choice-of-anchor D domain-containing protein [bacterium]
MHRSTATSVDWKRLGVLMLVGSACLLQGCELGTGASGPECLVTPAALSFGTVSVGSHADLSFVVKNVGIGILEGFVGGDHGDYSILGGDGSFSLESGVSWLVTVRFSPTAGGPRIGSVDLGTERCSTVGCFGTGSVGPSCEIEPTSLDFGVVAVGSFGVQTFQIGNTGDGVLTGHVSEDYPHYSILGGDGPFSLIYGQTVTVTVEFEPTSTGIKTAAVNTGTPCANVACTGVGGEGPVCQLNPADLDFGSVLVGSYGDLPVEITNIGGGTLTGFVYADCTDYSIMSGAGAFSLGATETHTIMVRFSPTTPGVHTCTVETGTDLCSDVPCNGVAFVR